GGKFAGEVFSGGDSAGELECDGFLRSCRGDVVSANGVAIDGGIIEGRQVGGGANFFGGDATEGVRQRDRFRFRCWKSGEDFFHGLFELEHAESVEGREAGVESEHWKHRTANIERRTSKGIRISAPPSTSTLVRVWRRRRGRGRGRPCAGFSCPGRWRLC